MGIWQQILLGKSHWVREDETDSPAFFPPLIDFFFSLSVGTDNLNSSRELDQNSEVAQACDRKDEQVCF